MQTEMVSKYYMRTKISVASGSLLALLGTTLLFSACHTRSPGEWSIGYWIWGEWSGGGHQSAAPDSPVDLIVFNMGELELMRRDYSGKATGEPPAYRFNGINPNDLPAAKRYGAVVRLNAAPFKKKDAVTPVLKRFKRLQYQFQEIHRPLNEIQLDFDCPTALLPRYADWLGQWRRQLPAGTRLTITALLDWFNPGAAIGQVLSKVDGFVPQFYDVDIEDYLKRPKIAHFPDHLKWGPIFERFKVPYQIGLSSFGRIQLDEHVDFTWETPLDVLSRLAGEPHVYSNPGGERVLEMNLLNEFSPDEPDECPPTKTKGIMIQSTAESILRGYQEARSMGRYCAGVLFFRWPSSTESLALKPNEITDILSGKAQDNSFSLEALDAECALVDCRDLSLMQKNRFPIHVRTIAIKSSMPLEYFLPSKGVKSTMINPNEMQFQIPPYNAAAKIFLGRAVAGKPAEYSMRVIQ
jgi:hypothetical protein